MTLFFLRFLLLFICSGFVAARAITSLHGTDSLELSELSIASRSELSTLQKRTQINLSGFPAANDLGEADVNRYIDQIAQLAQYIVDNVHNNHATFLRFFGSPEFYDDVMRVLRRIANIRSGNGGPSLNINFHNTNGPDDIGADGQPAPAAAQYENINGQPTLDIFQQWPSTQDVMSMVPGPTTPGLVEQFARTRQGILLHELFHWAGDNTLFGNVVDENAHPDYPTGTPQRIVDIFIGQAILGSHTDAAFLTQHNVDPTTARAYGETNVLLLPQLNFGPELAVQNADSYTLFLFAVYINFNSRVIPMEIGEARDRWNGGDFGDPLQGTQSPFSGALASALNSGLRALMVWIATGRATGKTELKL